MKNIGRRIHGKTIVVVSADHIGTPVAAVGDIITWLHLLASK